MLYNRCTGICKFGYNTYPRRIRRRSNLGHIFRGGGSASHGPGNTVSSVRNSLFKTEIYFFISNFLHVAIVLFFPVGDTPASEFYVPTFRHTVFFQYFADGTDCSETSAHKIQTSWNHPKRKNTAEAYFLLLRSNQLYPSSLLFLLIST